MVLNTNKLEILALAKIQASPLAKIKFDRIRWEGGEAITNNHQSNPSYATIR